MTRNLNYFIILLLFSLSGCSVSNSLKKWDERVGQFLISDTASTTSPNSSLVTSGENATSTTWRSLTIEQKQAIDAWLEANGYNRYGDSMGVLYTGGTPLFDETNGATKDRFEYILERQPGILDSIWE